MRNEKERERREVRESEKRTRGREWEENGYRKKGTRGRKIKRRKRRRSRRLKKERGFVKFETESGGEIKAGGQRYVGVRGERGTRE